MTHSDLSASFPTDAESVTAAPQEPTPASGAAVTTHSNSGDGLGIHKPGSMTWGGD